MNIFDEVNNLSIESILNRINLPTAKDGKSYICPNCGHGKGGDGIKPRISKGRVRWKCFSGACGKDFSNFDLVATTLGLDPERDKVECARRIKELFPECGDEEFSSSRAKESARRNDEKLTDKTVQREQKKSASTAERKNYSGFYEHCRANVSKFFADNGGKWRGLTKATFEKYGLGIHEEFGVEGEIKTSALIVPYDDYHFMARKLKDIEGNQKVTQHGEGAGLYETLPISIDLPNFIVEGEIDALSIAQVFPDLGIGCVATGGAAKYGKVVAELEKRFANAERKPSFVVMFDNDKAGKTSGLKLVNELKAAGYPAVLFFLEEKTAGEYETENRDGTTEKITVKKVDANDLLQQGGAELVNQMTNAIEQTDMKLKAQAEAMKQSAEQERQEELNKSGIQIFSFAEYFDKYFSGDIALTEKYSARKTGFENIDAAQVFIPGVYVLGALPATGKTTFAWQLLNQLANNGESCLYCSFEMSKFELFTKSIAREFHKTHKELSTGLNLSNINIRRGAGKNCKEFNDLVNEFAKSTAVNLRVLELSNTGVAELIEGLKPFCVGVEKSPVICVDYLQIMPSKGSKATAKEKIDEITLRLKDFQRETNATLIIISSFNRENYYQDVSFSSFKESGAIEYSADVIWGLEIDVGNIAASNKGNGKGGNNGSEKGDNEAVARKKAILKASKEPERKIKFSCLKNRNGGIYDCLFTYYAPFDYFKPLDKEISNKATSSKTTNEITLPLR